MAPPAVYTLAYPLRKTPVSKKRSRLDDPSSVASAEAETERLPAAKKEPRLHDPTVATAEAKLERPPAAKKPRRRDPSAAKAEAQPERQPAAKKPRLDYPSVSTAEAEAAAKKPRLEDPSVETAKAERKRPHVAKKRDRKPVTVPRCIVERDFVVSTKIGEGSYGTVFKASDNRDGHIVALKRLVHPCWRAEVKCLDTCRHPNIVRLKGLAKDAEGEAKYLVLEFAYTNLWQVLQSRQGPFSEGETKFLMLQLLRAVKCIHDHRILHRDLKTTNILVDGCGDLKICDFGFGCKQRGTSPYTRNTMAVGTLGYMAPELLLGAKKYSSAIDMWSLGCVMAEMLNKQALFQGTTESDQIRKRFSVLGTPNLKVWPVMSAIPEALRVVGGTERQGSSLRRMFPMLSPDGYEFLQGLLNYDPEQRLTAQAALKHAWFHESPLPVKPQGLHED